MSKLRYYAGLPGPGRHRLGVQHEGAREHMRVIFKRHSDEPPAAFFESASPEQEASRVS